jgi:hypothetical protein
MKKTNMKLSKKAQALLDVIYEMGEAARQRQMNTRILIGYDNVWEEHSTSYKGRAMFHDPVERT